MLLQRSSPNGMKRSSSTEYLLISECVQHTVQGMWGNVPRAEPVRAIKQIERDLPLASGRKRNARQTTLALVKRNDIREEDRGHRTNARNSRGPRTASGKGRVSRNALRHG